MRCTMTLRLVVASHYRAAAKIGLRQLASASTDLRQLTQITAYREDPYLQTQRALTDARLSIAQRDLALARAKLEEPSREDPTPATDGERMALLALVFRQPVRVSAPSSIPSRHGALRPQLKHISYARSVR